MEYGSAHFAGGQRNGTEDVCGSYKQQRLSCRPNHTVPLDAPGTMLALVSVTWVMLQNKYHLPSFSVLWKGGSGGLGSGIQPYLLFHAFYYAESPTNRAVVRREQAACGPTGWPYLGMSEHWKAEGGCRLELWKHPRAMGLHFPILLGSSILGLT